MMTLQQECWIVSKSVIISSDVRSQLIQDDFRLTAVVGLVSIQNQILLQYSSSQNSCNHLNVINSNCSKQTSCARYHPKTIAGIDCYPLHVLGSLDGCHETDLSLTKISMEIP